ncbi:hypothetical protein D3C86_2137520 [compost metagenome]
MTKDTNAAISFAVITVVRVTGFVSRKSAVFSRASLDTIDVPKFMAWMAPIRTMNVKAYV